MTIKAARFVTCSAAYLAAAGCASTQLNFNTLDLASTVDDLTMSQVVYNIGRFVIDPYSNPTQVTVSGGSASTTNQGSVSLSSPLNPAITLTNTAAVAAGAVLPAITNTRTSAAGSFGLTPSATNQASQNWSIATNTDADQQRRLRALYRFVTYTEYADLCSEYPLIVTQASTVASDMSATDLDASAWTAAKNTNNVAAAFEDYLRVVHNRGLHVDAANLLIQVYTAKKPGTSDEETEGWAAALKQDDTNAYSQYLNDKDKYSGGLHYRDEALQQLNRLIRTPKKTAATGATTLPTASGAVTATAIDAQFLREPGCVICSDAANVGNINAATRRYAKRYCPIPGKRSTGKIDLYVNPRLHNHWLLLRSPGEPEPPNATYIGRYDALLLYTSDPEAFHQFTMFTLEATSIGSAAGQSGKSGTASKAAAPVSLPFGGAVPIISP
jgi:hypothetical protein